MKAGDLGEFALIDRLAARLARPRADVVAAIGHDVAAVRMTEGRLLLATCDAQVEGVHFLLDRCDPRRLGRKAAAVNVSDVAAAGGVPTHFLCSLIVPRSIEVAFLEALYDGLAAEADAWGADVVGGNVSTGERLTLDLTLLGEALPAELRRRDGARVGDAVLVTGALGAAAAGLHLSRNPALAVSSELRREALDALELPVPRLPESRALARAGGVTASIDVSDGLAADLGHLCDASGVGVRLFAARIPIAAAARGVAEAAGVDPLDWALSGGEDYELLFTAPPDRAPELTRAVQAAGGAPLTTVGTIVADIQGRMLVLQDQQGTREIPLRERGFEHLR